MPGGRLLNAGMLLTCTMFLLYPFLHQAGLVELNCFFQRITGLPCPGCGYSRAIGSLMEQEFLQSFLHNPGWMVWALIQLALAFIAGRSLISGRQFMLPGLFVWPLVVMFMLIWAGKFLIGPSYY